MILEKYRHLTTPSIILNSLEEAKPKRKPNDNFDAYTKIVGSHDRFLTDSIRYRKEKGQKSNIIPFNTYFPTFDSMDTYRKQFYFYWRNEAAKGNFLDTELSYIFLFSYELLNYGYNSDASFNISMLEHLYSHYVKRYPRLEKYLPVWIADFLFELGELELASEWSYTAEIVDSDYENLKALESKISNISITTWWKFIPERTRSPFFAKYKTKIYTTFKECIAFLHEHYLEEDDENGFFEHLYTVQNVFVTRELFTSAVLARNTIAQSVSIVKRVVNQEYCHFLSQLMRLAENYQRTLLNHEALLPVNENLLPLSLQAKLLEHLKTIRQHTRFVKVADGDKTVPNHTIPPNPYKELEIELDRERIKELSDDSDDLKRLFEEKYGDDDDTALEFQSPASTVIQEATTVESIFHRNHLSDEAIAAFISCLTEIEKEILIRISNGQFSIAPLAALLKSHGMMMGTFLIELNEKAEEILEDIILEEVDGDFEVTQELQFILKLLEA